jgi:hypothetical protein
VPYGIVRRAKRIDYLVASTAPGEPHRWVAYVRNGPYVQGDAAGHVVRVIGR